MSDDRSQKIFDATPARKHKAKREGNSARSSEVSAIAAFGCATLASFATIPWLAATGAAAIREAGARPDLAHLPGKLALLIGLAVIPICAAAAGGIAASFVQTGGLHLVMPTFSVARLNPIAGIKRMVGAEAAVGAARALVAFGVAAVAVIPLGFEIFARSLTLSGAASFGVLFEAGAQRACVATIAVGACFAVADYGLVRRKWLRDLKMTREEIRREHKENDGDPQMRNRRKTLHRTLTRGSLARTKDATFVVVNPTHIAIAVRYAPPTVPVPEILVRAVDEAARTVKALAATHGIPIVENIALARALFAQGEAGAPIPSATFVAVARVIAELIRAGAIE